jgi:co-chaperonin GroES (HSP10)
MRPLAEQAKGAHIDANQHRATTRLDGKVVDDAPEEPWALRAIGDHIYIQRLRVAESKGGIIFPETFSLRKKFSARERLNSVPELFHAIVLSAGPRVRELSQGDEIIVYSFAGDESLYTGVSVGEKNRMFITPNDVVCAVERE